MISDERRGRRAISRARGLLQQACEALEEAHALPPAAVKRLGYVREEIGVIIKALDAILGEGDRR